MTSLAEKQAAFLRAIHDDRLALPDGWGNSQAVGIEVYRGNYRYAVMGALADIFERTAIYVGEGPFRQASMHHVIHNPPSGWTLDDVGEDFDQTCAQLFASNIEVAELAWLEWRLRDLATAPDADPVTPEAFAQASAEFGEEDWTGLTLQFQPRSAAKLVGHDLEAMWRALGEEPPQKSAAELATPQTCITWREGERPTFRMFEADHAIAFTAMSAGGSYADMIGALIGDSQEPGPETVQNAAMRAGSILGQWFKEGIVTAINPA
ncbi:MAG: DNA-binding domain-containing protein [Pseudomonadota bacterium]